MKKKILIFFCICLLFSGCVSLVEKTGRTLDGSVFTEKRITLYRTDAMELSVIEGKTGKYSIIITFNKYPMMKLRCSFPDENANVYLYSLEYLSGNVHGWNEFTLELLGAGNLILAETASFKINDDVEPVLITAGRIHRYDTRITGDEAVVNLRNRHERIVFVAEWMESLDTPVFNSINDFKKYWKPVLFPELVSRKQRPSGWLQDGDRFQKAQDIRWNTDYTQRVFPKELNHVRNSGTLLRDWEEALSWIYMEYEWKNIIEILSQQITFNKAR